MATAERLEIDRINAEVASQSNLLVQAISALQGKTAGGGTSPIIEALEITANGTYTATGGVDGYSPITVSVASSGVPDGYSAYKIGSFTLAEDKEDYNIMHRLGVVPNIYGIYAETDTSLGGRHLNATLAIQVPSATGDGYTVFCSGDTVSSSNYYIGANASRISYSTGLTLKAAVTYHWFVGVLSALE